MFTEDDDKVVVKKEPGGEYDNIYEPFIKKEKSKLKKNTPNKKKKSNNDVKKQEPDYSNFYSSFLEQEKEKQDDNKKKKKEEIEFKTEDDYKEVYESPKNHNNKGLIKIIFFGLEIILVIFLIVFLISKLTSKKIDIILNNTEYYLNIGENALIQYEVVNSKEQPEVSFNTSDINVAVVDNVGKIIGVGKGETDIIVTYRVEGKTNEKKCKVIVSGEGSVDKNISLDVRIENAKENTWVNHDVYISTIGKSIYGISSLQYTINCDSNCSYENVNNNKITITNSGVNKVTIKARDKNNQEISKNVVVKVDKQAPTITFNGQTNITATNSTTVCATCKDSHSGCKKEKVCVKYTSSKTNQKITIEDNVGNKTSSPEFNVKINKSGSNDSDATPTCSLSVSSSGVVTAKVSSNSVYYGFNSSYSGTNTKTQDADKDMPGTGSRAKIIHYYVKNSKGAKGSCYITVIRTCDSSSCTYKAG